MLKPQRLFAGPLPKSNTFAPSVKNGRFSGKNVSNCVRFRTAGSTSTWPKSGLIVPVSVRLDDRPYLRSTPASMRCSLAGMKGLSARLCKSLRATPYGTTSNARRGLMPWIPSRSAKRETNSS